MTHLPKLTECTTSRVNRNVNYGLWVIMMCQGRFINRNKWTTVVGNVDSGRGCECVRGQEVFGNSVLSAQFCCEPKTGLKNKLH